MKKGRLDDPLLRQFVPLQEEEIPQAGFIADPLQESAFCKTAKLLSKYSCRALLMPTAACALHCRYCFRRNFPFEKGKPAFERELELIRKESSLKEIILSGGDPLSLPNRELKDLMEALESIPHLRRLRFHTRFPVGIPERIDAALLTLFARCSLQIVFVIHCNHPHELDSDVLASLKAVQRLGIPVLAQTVLLKGVNEDFLCLQELFETLADHGIVPYYLHQLDAVAGAAHFHVPKEKGLALMQQLKENCSGYAVPRYVEEIPGALHKSEFI